MSIDKFLMKKQFEPVKVQLILWTLYFLLKLVLLYILESDFYFIDFFLSHVLLALVFYINSVHVFKYCKVNLFKTVYLSVVYLALYLILRYLIKIPFINILYGIKQGFQLKLFLIESGYLYFQLYLVSFGYWTIKRSASILQKVEKEKTEILLEKQSKEILTARMELDFLKAQINPHFLYNTLSFLYSKSVNNSPELAEAIYLLSNIMRYSLSTTEGENHYVRLSKELEHIENLIKIYKIRFNNQIYVKLSYDPLLKDVEVIPLIFITVIENAFKYGILHDPNKPIAISFKIEENYLYFTCINHVPVTPRKYNESSGIGLNNTIRRLTIYYKDRFEHKNYMDGDRYIFEVLLRI